MRGEGWVGGSSVGQRALLGWVPRRSHNPHICPLILSREEYLVESAARLGSAAGEWNDGLQHAQRAKAPLLRAAPSAGAAEGEGGLGQDPVVWRAGMPRVCLNSTPFP